MEENVIDQLARFNKNPMVFGYDDELARAEHKVEISRPGFTSRRAENIDSLIAHILMHDVQDTSSLMNGLYEDLGTEFLAWYQSYHHWGEDWGIFLDVNAIARFIQDYDVGSEPALILSILHHERFHFLVEYACAAVSYPIPGSHGSKGNQTYERFGKEQRARRELFEIEEAMANAYALTRWYPPPAKFPRKLRQNLCAVYDLAPAGYKDFRKVSSHNLWGYGRERDTQPSTRVFSQSCGELYANLLSPDEITYESFSRPTTPVTGGKVLAGIMMSGEQEFANVPVYLCFPQSVNPNSSTLSFEIERGIIIDAPVRFQKSLRKISKRYPWIDQAWNTVVERLANRSFNPAHIQKWSKDGPKSWHVRVSNNRSPAFRAHLVERSEGQHWIAEKIGTHKEMGHG